MSFFYYISLDFSADICNLSIFYNKMSFFSYVWLMSF